MQIIHQLAAGKQAMSSPLILMLEKLLFYNISTTHGFWIGNNIFIKQVSRWKSFNKLNCLIKSVCFMSDHFMTSQMPPCEAAPSVRHLYTILCILGQSLVIQHLDDVQRSKGTHVSLFDYKK